MVTLKDIAAEAGVSITTVSNVVHNRKSRVSEKKVAKIWEIIEREHYVPSMSARSLANDQSAIIAMVTYITPRTTGSTVSDPFMSSVAASVEQRTREAGYYLMLRSAESVAALEGLIHSWRLSGLIMTGLFQDSFFDAVAKLGIPVVLIDSYVDDPNICCVGLEDEKGGYLATKHLLENGHRVIAFASPPISPRALSNYACRATAAPWRNTACRTTRRLSLRRKFPCRRARSWGINSAHVPKSRGFSPRRIFWRRASCPGCMSAG